MSNSTEQDPNLAHGGVDVDEPAAPTVDLVDVLTIAELDAGSRELGTSIVRQITTQGERYEAALAVVLWLHARRSNRGTDPRQLLTELRGLSFVQLSERAQQLSEQLGAAAASEGDADPLG